MSNFPEKKIFEEADNWIKNNKKVSLATVVQTWGSSPLGIGSRMIVSEDGNFLGSVSGGCLEDDLISKIRADSLIDRPTFVSYGVTKEKLKCLGFHVEEYLNFY